MITRRLWLKRRLRLHQRRPTVRAAARAPSEPENRPANVQDASAPSAAIDVSDGAPAAVADDERDLNKVSAEELKEAKAAMETEFERCALKPGDAGYVHDKRVEAPTDDLESNEWDEDIESVNFDDEEDPLAAALRAPI